MPVVLITEDGTGRSDANTYVSLTEANAYFEARVSASAWTNATDDEKKVALVHACRILDSYVAWIGYPSSTDQALEWPRAFVSYEKSGFEYFVDSDEIPARVKDAQCELALIMLSGDIQKVPDTAGFSSISIAGAISLVVDRATQQHVIPDVVWNIIQYLGARIGGGASVALCRG